MEQHEHGLFVLIILLALSLISLYLILEDSGLEEIETYEEDSGLEYCEESCDWDGDCINYYCRS